MTSIPPVPPAPTSPAPQGSVRETLATLGRYTGDGGRHLVDQYRTNRSLIGVAARQAFHPFRLHTAAEAYGDALARQAALFTAQHVDDVTDAMRHAGASALVVDRVVRSGASPEAAAELMRRIGRAHERDSELSGLHRVGGETMDLHNNELGIELGLAHVRAADGAGSAAGEQALEGSVLRALAAGRGLLLDSPTSPPRPTSSEDLRAVLRDPSLLDQLAASDAR